MSKIKISLVSIILLMVFLFAGTVSAEESPPSEVDEVDDLAVMEALAIRYVAGEELIAEEEAAAIRYVTVASIEEWYPW